MDVAIVYENNDELLSKQVKYFQKKKCDVSIIYKSISNQSIDKLEVLNCNIRNFKYDLNHYDIAIFNENDIWKINARKKVVIGDYEEKHSRIIYINKLDINEILNAKLTKDKKFSVIVPNYNNGKWIDKTIESVLNQTYKNWEMYIIDDVSTDNSIEVIESFKDDRITLIKNNIKLYNGGSRNIGILRSKESNPEGYFIFIDSDDWLAYNELFEELNDFIYDEDLITMDYQLCQNNELTGISKCSYRNKDDLFTTNGCMVAIWNKCVKVSVMPLFEFNTLMEDRCTHYRLINRINSYANFGKISHIWNKMNTHSITSDRKQLYTGELQTPIQWENCCYRHIAAMKDLLSEITNPLWVDFLKKKIEECLRNANRGIYQQL